MTNYPSNPLKIIESSWKDFPYDFWANMIRVNSPDEILKIHPDLKGCKYAYHMPNGEYWVITDKEYDHDEKRENMP